MARILVVDDEEQVRSVFRRALESDGHEVDEAADGKLGTEFLRRGTHDLVLLDIVMPEQDGLETIAVLRRDFPALKILAVSGGGRTGLVDYLTIAEKLGVDRTLHKPILPQDLIQVVRELLPAADAEPDQG